MAKEVMVGLRTDATIDVDVQDDDEDGRSEWSFHNLDLEKAKFLHEELGDAIRRAEARAAKAAAAEPPKVRNQGPYGDM